MPPIVCYAYRLSSLYNGVYCEGEALQAAIESVADDGMPAEEGSALDAPSRGPRQLRRPRWVCTDASTSEYQRLWAPVPPAVYAFQSWYKGVDLFDQLASTHGTRRSAHRWYMYVPWSGGGGCGDCGAVVM